MGLLEIPGELQIAIAKHLPSPVNLARVHPRLRHTAESLLYSDISFIWEKEKPAEAVMLLLRALLERPDLGQRIRTLNLRCDRYCHRARKGQMHQLEPFLLTTSPPDISDERLVATMQALGFVDQDVTTTWASQIRQANSDAVVALIVALAPNLIQLSLSEKWAACYDYLSLVFSKALCPSQAEAYRLPKYSQLASVSLTPLFHIRYMISAPERDDILALFYLPGIEKLSLPIANRASMMWPDERPPEPVSLKVLEIHRLREQYLAPILSVCSNLQSLHYRWFHQMGVDKPLNKDKLVLDDIASTIARHCGSTLKALKLDAKTQCSWGDGDEPFLEISGSLAALKGLQVVDKMDVPWPFVYGNVDSPSLDGIRKVVPPGIRYLQLKHQLGRYEEYMWTSYEILELIKGELDAGLKETAQKLEGIEISLLISTSGDIGEPMKREIERLRSSHIDVKVDKGDRSVYINLLDTLQHRV
ncbi:hypothetical protein B0I35DRAFT_194431 [Stachybotrys elegans]|uniref:F-box domain-containing protein n=1 Tax=Stachybotrys elegans TaxID=80388 RepID=A0A8K0SX28_9HYPO|nr:hypothetical protein B0I35DRAFT_194431 [Stachybotrys elegans]